MSLPGFEKAGSLLECGCSGYAFAYHALKSQHVIFLALLALKWQEWKDDRSSGSGQIQL